MAPRGIKFYAFSGSMLLMGAIFCAFMFGEIAFLMSNLNKKQAQFTNVQDQVFTTMKNMKLPDDLQLRIEDFLNSSYYLLENNDEYEKSIEIIPPSLRIEVNRQIFQAIFQRNVMFVDSSIDALEFVLKRLEHRFCQPETEVIIQYEDGNELFYIAQGRCEVSVYDEFEKPRKVRQLTQGYHFGEVSLLYNTKRTAPVKTVTYSNLATLSQDHFQSFLNNFPESKDALIHHMTIYKDPWRRFIRRMFASIPYLRNLPDKIFNEILYSLQFKYYEKDEYLYLPGETSSSMYIIIKGKVQIYVAVKDTELVKLMHRDAEDPLSCFTWLEPAGNGVEINMPVNELKNGDILCPKTALAHGEHILPCKAVEQTKVIMLATKLIHEVSANYYPLKEKLDKYYENLFIFDNFRMEKIHRNIPLDIIKCHNYNFANRNSWKILQKFKNATIKIIIKNQKNRKAEIPNIKVMLIKLKAILTAEQKGLEDIAKRIGIGDIPIDALNLLEILKLSDIENPLLIQFAEKAKEALIVFQYMCDQFKNIRSKIECFDKDFEKLQINIIEVHHLLDEAIALARQQ